MNCKPGDLARVIRPGPRDPSSLDLIVEVIRFSHTGSFVKHGLTEEEPVWEVRAPRAVVCANGSVTDNFNVPDAFLRPLRDPGDDATDETLIYAGKPQEVSHA